MTQPTKLFSLTLLIFLASGTDAYSQAHRFLKGTYATLQQFLHDSVKPGSACDVYVKSSSQQYTEYIIYDSVTGKKIKPVFAYSDGDTVYLNRSVYMSAKWYTRSLEHGRLLYFEDYFSGQDGDPVVIPVFLAGGLLGVAVYYALAGPEGDRDTTEALNFKGIKAGRRCGIILDTKLGTIRGVSPDNFAGVFARYPDLVVEKYASSAMTLADIRKCVRELNARP